MPISSLFLRSGVATLACLSLFATKTSAATYELQDTYEGPDFFDQFTFFTDADPTNGFVTYVDEATALSDGIISIPASNSDPAVFGVDSTNTFNVSGAGRTSVRLSSIKTYTHALIISDIGHMPGGICGTWPAHWTLGPDWPANGEIDIIEGVNNAADNLMSLHTSPGCTDAGADELGTLQTSDCDTSVNYNSGCGVTADTSASYGTGFNGGSGGVYATEWTSSYIRIWFFPTGSVPADITAGAPVPDTTTWGLPQANFQGSCSIDSHFADHQIIFDTTFCGDYGNSDWNSNTACQAIAGAGTSCNAYVADNPTAFTNAYWSVNSIKVYQQSGNTSFSSTSSATSASVTAASSIIAPGMGSSSTTTTSSMSSLSVTGNYSRTATSATAPYSAATVATVASASATATNPSTVDGFTYVGCLGSTSGFSTFVEFDNSPTMSLEVCASTCANYQFMGLFNTICFCAETVDADTSIAAADGLTCKNPCPGNLNELCGGTRTTSRLARRQATDNTLLTVYENTASNLAAEISSGLSAAASAVNSVLSSVVPASKTFAYGMGGGAAASQISSIVLSTTYVDVCTACEGGLTTVSYTTTIAHCGCVANEASGILNYGNMTSAANVVPMTTVTKACGCGSNGAASTIAVTVPAAVVAVASASSVLATATGASAAAAIASGVASNGTIYSNGTTAGIAAAAEAVAVAAASAAAAAETAGATATTTSNTALFTGGASAVSGSVFGLVAGFGAAMLIL